MFLTLPLSLSIIIAFYGSPTSESLDRPSTSTLSDRRSLPQIAFSQKGLVIEEIRPFKFVKVKKPLKFRKTQKLSSKSTDSFCSTFHLTAYVKVEIIEINSELTLFNSNN